MYNYWWRRNQNVTEYITVIEGMFIAELVRSFEAVVAGEKEVVYRHVFAHDGDIAPLLGALGIKALRWPGMGSNVAFEFWYVFSITVLAISLVANAGRETSESEVYARVLYSGRTLETIYGALEWIPVSKLVGILEPFIPEDIFKSCSS